MKPSDVNEGLLDKGLDVIYDKLKLLNHKAYEMMIKFRNTSQTDEEMMWMMEAHDMEMMDMMEAHDMDMMDMMVDHDMEMSSMSNYYEEWISV